MSNNKRVYVLIYKSLLKHVQYAKTYTLCTFSLEPADWVVQGNSRIENHLINLVFLLLNSKNENYNKTQFNFFDKITKEIFNFVALFFSFEVYQIFNR